MVFPVVMYGCESWTVKTAEGRRIDAFELWCWRRLLRVPWTARRSNQSILSPGCSLEGMMLKLKLQYFGHLMWRVYSLEKTLILGGIGGRRRSGWQRMRWLEGITDSMWVWVNSGTWWWTGRPGVLQFMGSQRVGHNWVTELNWIYMLLLSLRCRISFWLIFFSPAASLLGPKKQDCFPNHFILWKLSNKWCKQTSICIFFQPIKSSVNLKYLGILLVDNLGCRKIN